MKKLIFLMLISLSAAHAQDGGHEKITALKTAFITDKLQLTSSEAQQFWPVYNTYDRQFHDLRDQRRNEVYAKLRNCWADMTDDEANALIDRYLTIETNELALKKDKTEALRKVISPKKIISLKIAEEDFKRELLDKYRTRKSEKEKN